MVAIGAQLPEACPPSGGGTATLNVVAVTGGTETIDFVEAPSMKIHDLTMDQNCVISFDASATPAGSIGQMMLILSGGFTPTFPAATIWSGGIEPAYVSPATYEFLTVDGGTTVFAYQSGSAMS